MNNPNSASTTERRLPPFIKKLWCIMNDRALSSIIRWSEDGASICISNSVEFCKTVLPRYFKHNNWHSFVRQLNLYGFRKVYHFNIAVDYVNGRQETVWQFKHKLFQRNYEDSLHLIHRRLSCPASDNESVLTVVLSGIENQLEKAEKQHAEIVVETQLLRRLQNEQQELLDILMQDASDAMKRSALQQSHHNEEKELGSLLDNQDRWFSLGHHENVRSDGDGDCNNSSLSSVTSGSNLNIIRRRKSALLPSIAELTSNCFHQK